MGAAEEVVLSRLGVVVAAGDAQVGELSKLGEVSVVGVAGRVQGDLLLEQVVF